jgi:hypothetical protein
MKHKDMCFLLVGRCECGFKSNSHGSNPHLCIILAFVLFKCVCVGGGGTTIVEPEKLVF